MNNIYVDKLRKTCSGCFCKDCDSWCSLLKRYMDYKDERKRPKDCPLKLITDRLAEERKKVVQEIKSCINDRIQNESCFITRDENGKPITTMATICSNYTINELSYLIKFLDKVEGENNGRDRTNKI